MKCSTHPPHPQKKVKVKNAKQGVSRGEKRRREERRGEERREENNRGKTERKPWQQKKNNGKKADILSSISRRASCFCFH